MAMLLSMTKAEIEAMIKKMEEMSAEYIELEVRVYGDDTVGVTLDIDFMRDSKYIDTYLSV